MSFKIAGFTDGPIAAVLARTALPIVFLTSINGALTVIDAGLLGAFAGEKALAAVTLMFPANMALIALSTMVSSGMASVMARQLGAGNLPEARSTFAGAHGLLVAVSAAIVIAFALLGWSFVTGIANGSDELAQLAYPFLAVTVLTSPVMLLVALHSDALRAENRAGFMALAGLIVSLGNIVFNVVLIAGLGLGVVGPAIGTAMAQALALTVILVYRSIDRAPLALPELPSRTWLQGWRPMLALGAPRSLNFFGIVLGSVAVIIAVRLHVQEGGEATIAAYGIVMRLMTFAYLPLLGLSLAMQAVVGNNVGAGLDQRASKALRLSVVVAALYGAAIEGLFLLFRDSLGAIFVEDLDVIANVAEIVPFYVAAYVTLGPMMMVASYFQALGDARRAAFLSLARTYLFAMPLTFILPMLLGPAGIWAAMTTADLLLVLATAIVLVSYGRRQQRAAFPA